MPAVTSSREERQTIFETIRSVQRSLIAARKYFSFYVIFNEPFDSQHRTMIDDESELKLTEANYVSN